MRRDCFRNAISASSDDAAAGTDDFILGFLGYDLRIVNVLAAANHNTNDTLSNAYAGLLWMLSETGVVPDQARRYLAAAERSVERALPRERDAVGVLRHWIEDDVPASLRLIERVLDEHPRDLVMLKLHQYHDFNSGDFPAMLRVALGSVEAAGDVAYVHGMLAFAYEQCHLLDKAEEAARHALELEPREPWAQHALAHVMLTQGRIAEGAAFLESVAPTWEGLTSFMYTHHWWHLALFYLSQGRMTDALAAYDDHCWTREKDFSQDQIGAVSLLARFEFAGIDVGPRWNDLATYLGARRGDISQPFLSLQYLYGLARARHPDAPTLLAAMRKAATEGLRTSRKVWSELGTELAAGAFAHAEGNYEAAWRLISPHLRRLTEIGGSHAQRDLFEQLALDALIRAGHLVHAQQELELRRLSNPDDVPTNALLARVYDQLGLRSLALETAARARRVN